VSKVEKEGKGSYYLDGEKRCMIRCISCGRENWAPVVASGKCAWCGFDANNKTEEKKE
jgi:ribosomal protein L37E